MYTIHEGEIILKEKYGSSEREILYVKPPEQGNIVVLDDEKFTNIVGVFTKIFLPQGYPDSVSKDYIAYQVWDTAQAFCSTITGILATQEVLRGVGVGDNTATPIAATITWVMKDGCGHLGRILFAFTHGSYLDAYSKKWRLYADTLNDAAMCIEIALPMFNNYTTFALCVSTVMKAIVGVAGGATRMAMTQHHAVRGNMADVCAKDSAQETAVNLVASMTALFILTFFGNSLMIFIIMIVLHIVFNYFAVRAVCLRTLNEPRFIQVIDNYLKREIIDAPCIINRNEPIIFYQLGPNLLDLKLCGFQIKLGCSIKKIINRYPKAKHIKTIKEIYSNEKYILIPNINKREMNVLLKEDAVIDDILCAYFHAVLLSIITCALNGVHLSIYQSTENPRPFAQVCHTLQAADWSRDATDVPCTYSSFAYEPSYDLMKYVDNIAQKEWLRIKTGLLHTGWDLSKHLIMVDEWRVTSGKVATREISMEKIPFEDLFDVMELDENTEKETFTIEPDNIIPRFVEPSIAHTENINDKQSPTNSKEPK